MFVSEKETQKKEWTQKAESLAGALPKGVRRTLLHMFLFLCGLLLASVRTGDLLSPFGVSFLAAVPSRYILSAGLGAAAGYILTQDSVSALRYIAALLSAGVLARLACEFEKIRNFRLLPACISFLVCFLTGMALLTADGMRLQGFFLYLAESATAFVAAYFFSSAMDTAKGLSVRTGVSVRALPAAVFTTYLLLISFSDIAVYGVSFARVLLVYAMLLAAWLYKEPGGAIAGVAATAVFLTDQNVGLAACAYGAAGLLSAMFFHSKRYFGTLVFFASFAAAFLLTGNDADKIYLLAEAFAGCGLFLVTPRSILQKAERLTDDVVTSAQNNPQRQEILHRLQSAAHAVDEMSHSVRSVSEILRYSMLPEEKDAFARARDEVCSGCGRYAVCWEKNCRETLSALESMGKVLQSNEALKPTHVPPAFSTRCIKLSSMLESLNRQYVRSVERTAARRKIEEIRSVTADQFDGLCDILKEFSGEISEELTFDESAAARAREVLRNDFSVDNCAVTCIYNAEGKLRLELELSGNLPTTDRAAMKTALEEATGRALELPYSESTKTGLHLTYCERAAIAVEAAAAKITAEDEPLCGDSYESFYDGRGNYVVILSDGMGQGTRAALDSTMATTLTAKLVRAGIRYSSALKMVNSSLILKSKDESLATLDILNIDLYTGRATFYKAGAARSILLRQGKYTEVKKASLPAGILRDISFATAEGLLQEGDLLLLGSDGAFEDAPQAVKHALAQTKPEDSSAEISERIARAAKKQNATGRCDDITVIALKIKKNPAQ